MVTLHSGKLTVLDTKYIQSRGHLEIAVEGMRERKRKEILITEHRTLCMQKKHPTPNSAHGGRTITQQQTGVPIKTRVHVNRTVWEMLLYKRNTN